MSEGLKRSLSPETRAKISASKKAYHAKQPPSYAGCGLPCEDPFEYDGKYCRNCGAKVVER